MPELPEVETVRRGLAPVLEGHVITGAQTRRGDLRIPFPPRFCERLNHRRVKRLWRRAKYLLVDLDSNETLVIHLGMSGRIAVYGNVAADKPEQHGSAAYREPVLQKHDHVVIETDYPARIIFNDHRRFGLMTLIATPDVESHPMFSELGREPLSPAFTPAWLLQAMSGKRTSIKAALLDQRVIAGLGNIYVCEALFLARISPRRLAGSIGRTRTQPLVRAITKVLRVAINDGGSSLRDHKRVDGGRGAFQHRFAVYGRAGMPCINGCGANIRRFVQSGRSTFYCARCQK